MNKHVDVWKEGRGPGGKKKVDEEGKRSVKRKL